MEMCEAAFMEISLAEKIALNLHSLCAKQARWRTLRGTLAKARASASSSRRNTSRLLLGIVSTRVRAAYQ
jgi:hypothetical protein